VVNQNQTNIATTASRIATIAQTAIRWPDFRGFDTGFNSFAFMQYRLQGDAS
jgi:hypothetical protein